MDKPRFELGIENVTKRDKQERELSSKIISKFKDKNILDYKIYEYGVNRLNLL